MMKMAWLRYFLFLHLVGSMTSIGAREDSIELINLYDSTPMVLQALSHTDTALPIAVSVSHSDLNEIPRSILMAETWLRTHVLPYYPATKITTIVVGNSVLCNKNQKDKLVLVLPSMKNIYHSLTRWGLENDIKLSASFSSNCLLSLDPYSSVFKNEIAETIVKPLLQFLQTTNSTYSVNPYPYFTPLSERVSLVSSHTESMKKLGFFNLKKAYLVTTSTEERNSMSRKLSFIGSFPARPTPVGETSPSPLHSPEPIPVIVGPTPFPEISPSPFPEIFPKNPLPPLTAMSPSSMFFFPPEMPPFTDPASPPFDSTLPPCNPLNTNAPAPSVTGIPVVEKGLWCVAKPSVPPEILQKAMDYACGEGGADCEGISPLGSCYYPDTVVAHASYAFNSYWQKNKKNGGTCTFGGTAMIINTDPSFLHCRFVLS